MIYELTRDAMAEYESELFQVLDASGSPVTLQLTQVTPRRATRRQEMFSLVFRGPAERFLPQRMYRLEHDRLGRFDLLLVPIAQDGAGFVYEAAFNRLIQAE